MRDAPTVADDRALVLRVLDFTRTPGPRHRDEGEFSGEQFRDEYLDPRFQTAREEGKTLLVDLDGTSGYASSFLEEAFGGLVRLHSVDAVTETVRVKSDTRPWYKDEVENEYIRGAA